MPITLYADARSRDDDGQRLSLEAEAADYEAAYEALVDQVPEGWVLLGVSRWPTDEPLDS